MDKEELLNRLSDVITFYSDSHTNPQDKEEREEWNKNVRACEEIEKYIEITYTKIKGLN